MPRLHSLDHLVLTVGDIAGALAFYRDALGMEPEVFAAADGSRRHALRFGAQKINLHLAGAEFAPHATAPAPGSADLCFLSATPLADWIDHFRRLGIAVLQGPVPRSGATGPILSVYLRDPDGNLIEISNPRAITAGP